MGIAPGHVACVRRAARDWKRVVSNMAISQRTIGASTRRSMVEGRIPKACWPWPVWPVTKEGCIMDAAPDTPPQPSARSRLFEPGKYLSAPDVILRRRDLTPAAKLVWMALASHLGPDGEEVWPSATRIAYMVGIARDTAIGATKALESLGWVEIVKTPGKPNHYRLLQPQVDRSEKQTGRKNQPVGKANSTSRKNPFQPVGKTDPNYCIELLQEVIPPTHPTGGECAIGDAEAAISRVNAAMMEATGSGLSWLDRRRVRREFESGAGPSLFARIDAKAIRGAIAATPSNRTFGWGWLVRYLQRPTKCQTQDTQQPTPAEYWAKLSEQSRSAAMAEAAKRTRDPARIAAIAQSIAWAWRIAT
jgi:hypothetical protein